MNIKIYECGLDIKLSEAVDILKIALSSTLSKHDKNIKIAEAIGIIDTVRLMVDISEPEEQATDKKE